MIIALQMLILLRESVLAVLNGWLPPFFTQLVRKLSDNGLVPVKEEIEEHVYADYDEECGVVFFPPVYAQRYAAVCDCLMDERWFGRLEKVLNIGKHYDINFMRYLTEVSGVTQILGLDIACSLNCTCDILDLSFNDYERWEKPLQITLLQGNAADPDYRLIGCDAVIAIEMVQKLLPHDLDRLVHNVFGFIKPWVALFTTPNADFNCLMKNLDKNGLRQTDHYFEWTREQLHDWCSNIVGRYPEYMVMSRGVGPGPAGTSHYGCFSQLVLFVSKHYKKEMELNVNSLVLVSNLPEPDQVSEIGWITPTCSTNSSHGMFNKLLEVESSELPYSKSSSEGTLSSMSESIRVVKYKDKSIQCNLDVEFGKSFVMFNEDELYQIRTPRKRPDGNVYEIGDVARRLNNTMYEVKQFSKTTQYLMEKNETSSKDLMDEILELTEKLTCKMNLSSGDDRHVWNNVNWGENVPYWNQYYKVVGVYNFPYEGRSEDDMILDLLSEEINKLFDKHVQDGNIGIPVDALMHAVKHITDDVERVIMLMEDSGYELEGESVLYTGVDVSEASRDESDSNSDYDSLSNGSRGGHDFNGRLLNRTLGRKIKMLRLMLPQEEDVKQVLSQVVCRLKKVALSSGQGKQGPARSKWLQSKLLELLSLMEKSILRRKLRNIERDPLKGIGYDTGDETASHLSRIKAEDDKAIRIVEKYETLLRMSADNSDEISNEQGSEKSLTSKYPDGSGNHSRVDVSKLNDDKEFFEVPVPETDDLNLSPNDELTRFTLDEQHTGSAQDWEETDMSLYHEDTIELNTRIYKKIVSPKHSKHKILPEELKVKTNIRTTKGKKTNSSNTTSSNKKSSIGKKKSKHGTSVVTFKRSVKNTSSCKVVDRKNEIARKKQEKVMNKMTYENTLNCIDKMRRKMGPTLVLSVPPKPIPGSILELCHPYLHQNIVEPFQTTNDSWDDRIDTPVAATEHAQQVEILSHSETVTVALQRMIGTDPDVDAEIYEHELELSDLTSLLNETSYFTHPVTEDSSNVAVYDALGIASPIQQAYQQQDIPVSCTVKTPVVEIVTQDERELIALQRSIGTDPEVDTEVYEQELENSKLTTSLDNIASFEHIHVGIGIVTSQEFFLYDINEPTTSKGIRHVSMDVQCGTEGQVSATTSFTCPLRMYGPALEYGVSTHDILKPFEPVASPWMKFVGIKIKDSNHQIKDTCKETETVFGPFAIVDETYINPQNSMVIETLHANRVADTLDYTKKKLSNLRTKTTKSPIQYGRQKSNEIRKKESNRLVTRFLHVPKGVRSKLSCGGVHIHSYKDLQVSEDVVYQGEWQRYRRPSNLKRSNQPSTDRLKYTRKTTVPPKPQKAIVQTTINSPIIIRNTKANKMKEAMTKMHMQTKLASTKQEMTKSRPAVRQVPKITSKSAVSHSKAVKEKSNKQMQPPRHTRFASKPTIIKENNIPTVQKRKVYIPPYLEKMSKKQHGSKTSNNIGADHSKSQVTGSLSNLLNVNNEQIISIPSQSKVEDLVSALLKVSVTPQKDISYVVYRNEMETSNCSTAIGNIVRTSSKENILRRKLSRDNPTYSSSNNAATVLNPVITNHNPFESRRQTTPVKPHLNRKSSDSKMVSRIKKIANLMFSKKPHTNNAGVKHSLAKLSISQSGSKKASNIDLVTDGATNNAASSEEPNKSSVIKSFFENSGGQNGSFPYDKSKEYCNKLDPKPALLKYSESNIDNLKSDLVFDCSESIRNTPESVSIPILVSTPTESIRLLENETMSDLTDITNETTTDYTSNIFDAMKQLIEECLEFKYSLELIKSKGSEDADLKRSDPDNITSIGSETYETGSSFHRTYDARSLASLTQSFTDFSYKSQPSASKMSESLADESWYVTTPSYYGNEDQSDNKETISITQKPKAGPAFSTFSVNTQPSPIELRQQPDYVNLVDSETGSCAQANRRATSEELLMSGRSSESYVSCVLDEEAAIPSWLYNISQQVSGSFTSSRHAVVPEVPEIVPELQYEVDVNGNELTVHGAGAGDGCGIHSDQSQDSSGQGSTFSSSASSTVHSESIVVDPASFLAGFAPTGERPNSSNAPAPAEDSIDTIDMAELDNQNRTMTRNRTPRNTHRVSLPASDADISSIDTSDVASD